MINLKSHLKSASQTKLYMKCNIASLYGMPFFFNNKCHTIMVNITLFDKSGSAKNSTIFESHIPQFEINK